MVHRKPRHHGIETGVRERQFGGITFAESDVGKPGFRAALCWLLQHLRREIERPPLRMPGPQATSSTVPLTASPNAVTKRSVNAPSVITADAEKVSACRVNSSRTRFS